MALSCSVVTPLSTSASEVDSSFAIGPSVEALGVSFPFSSKSGENAG